jgi:hypothetical protein
MKKLKNILNYRLERKNWYLIDYINMIILEKNWLRRKGYRIKHFKYLFKRECTKWYKKFFSRQENDPKTLRRFEEGEIDIVLEFINRFREIEYFIEWV